MTSRAQPKHFLMLSKNHKSTLFRVITILFGIFCALTVGEISLRIFGVGYGHSPLVSDPSIHHKHPANYMFTFHTPSEEFGGHIIRYDNQGLVSNPKLEKNPSTRKLHRIALMGDSFVEGLQVPYGSSLTGLLEKAARDTVVVRNYGVSGYSPIYYLRQWEDVVKGFRPTHVYVLLYSDDVGSDLSMAEKVGWSGLGEPPLLPGTSVGQIAGQMRKLYVARFIRRLQLKLLWWLKNRNNIEPVVGGFIEENPDISTLTSRIILSLADRIQNTGAAFTLMVVPSKYRLTTKTITHETPQFSDKWEEWAKRHGVRFLDLTARFEEVHSPFFQTDIHFSKEGHQITAAVIAADLPTLFHLPLANTNP